MNRKVFGFGQTMPSIIIGRDHGASCSPDSHLANKNIQKFTVEGRFLKTILARKRENPGKKSGKHAKQGTGSGTGAFEVEPVGPVYDVVEEPYYTFVLGIIL